MGRKDQSEIYQVGIMLFFRIAARRVHCMRDLEVKAQTLTLDIARDLVNISTRVKKLPPGA